MASWVDGWVNLEGIKKRFHSPNKVKEFVTKFYKQTLEYKALE